MLLLLLLDLLLSLLGVLGGPFFLFFFLGLAGVLLATGSADDTLVLGPIPKIPLRAAVASSTFLFTLMLLTVIMIMMNLLEKKKNHSSLSTNMQCNTMYR